MTILFFSILHESVKVFVSVASDTSNTKVKTLHLLEEFVDKELRGKGPGKVTASILGGVLVVYALSKIIPSRWQQPGK
jgi:hypothetical protein